MRGKVLFLDVGDSVTGITPAYAGKRSPGIAFFVPLWDHPRVCGEKRSWEAANFRLWGSPPRMRGKGSGKLHCSAAMGITPAYAGKSVFVRLKDSY